MTAYAERFYPGPRIGHRVLVHRSLPSTQDEARRLAAEGAPHGIAVRALVQTQGRGRFQRRWEADPGEALLVSVALRPSIDILPLLSMVAALAARDAVADLTGQVCGLKWPNDLLWEDRKLAGVLVESEVRTDGSAIAVIGIGLNLHLDAAQHPAIAGTATSLDRISGATPDDREAERRLLVRLDERYSAAAAGQAILAPWRDALTTLGRSVRIHQRERTIAGIAEDVDEDGRLLVRTPDGRLTAVAEGDVTLSG